MNPLVVPADQGKALNVIGNAITIKIHGRDTGGALCVIESVDQPGAGPPPHRHQREAETFHVLEGEYEFTCDGKRLRASPGATVFAPQGRAHSYKNIGPRPGRLLVAITPAGFEGFFEEVGALSPAAQQIPTVIALGKKYGLEFLPPSNT
jgi:quercetin dioxygenase-like cupin family protein